jgi:hypothetical protein
MPASPSRAKVSRPRGTIAKPQRKLAADARDGARGVRISMRSASDSSSVARASRSMRQRLGAKPVYAGFHEDAPARPAMRPCRAPAGSRAASLRRRGSGVKSGSMRKRAALSWPHQPAKRGRLAILAVTRVYEGTADRAGTAVEVLVAAPDREVGAGSRAWPAAGCRWRARSPSRRALRRRAPLPSAERYPAPHPTGIARPATALKRASRQFPESPREVVVAQCTSPGRGATSISASRGSSP